MSSREVAAPWPTVSFPEELWIDLGGKHLWMFPTPGHSDDGISIYIEEDKLLFAGDPVVNGMPQRHRNTVEKMVEEETEVQP